LNRAYSTDTGLERKRPACPERDSAKKCFGRFQVELRRNFSRVEATLMASGTLALQSNTHNLIWISIIISFYKVCQNADEKLAISCKNLLRFLFFIGKQQSSEFYSRSIFKSLELKRRMV